MTSFESPSPPAFASTSAGSNPVVELLPTMGDLDRLAGALDDVDRTLAELDGTRDHHDA